MSIEKSWFVFYTKSRQEKKVHEILTRKGFESFLPLQRVMRQWSDRRKAVSVPLFNSYIFVLIEEHAIINVLEIPGIAWNIRLNGKPAVLREQELETIKRFIETGLLIETSGMDAKFAIGDKVKVMDGPLKGAQGMVSEYYNKSYFSIVLDSIGQVITIQIEGNVLKPL